MNDCEYNIVNTDDIDNEADNIAWKYLLRQGLVFSTICGMFFICGMALGAPTVCIPQLRLDSNFPEAIDENMTSLLTSIFALSAIPWVIVLTFAASYFGRKIPLVFSTLMMLGGSIVFYYSTNFTHILLSEAMNGVVVASITTIGNGMSMTEYISPKYRGIFLSFISATCFWGVWLSNALGTFFHWRLIPLVMTVLSIYPMIAGLFWPESPYYLATKSKFDACIKSHRWLKGTTKQAEKELSKLLSSRSSSVSEEPSFIEVVMNKRFYKATLLCICLTMLFAFTGKFPCTVYSLDIIKKMTSSEKTAYTGMLILDGTTVFSMYVGSMLTRILKRRVLLFSTTLAGVISLVVLSLYIYLVHLSYLEENKFISIALLVIYSISLGCGPMIISVSMYGEFTPLQYKSFSVCLTGTIDKIVNGILIGVTPFIMRTLGLHGAFLFFGLTSAVCLLFLFIYMPETKDKTLFEISDAIYGECKEKSAK